MAAAAAAPLPAGAMVGAARPVEVDVVEALLPVAEAEPVAEGVPLTELELSSLTGALGGSFLPQRFLMLVVQAFWPSALPTFCSLHWPKRASQMKVGMVCV